MLETKYQICLMGNRDHNISIKQLVKNCLLPEFKFEGETFQKRFVTRVTPFKSRS